MAISSTMFGRTVLTGKDADQMLRQMSERKPNTNAQRSLANARARKAK